MRTSFVAVAVAVVAATAVAAGCAKTPEAIYRDDGGAPDADVDLDGAPLAGTVTLSAAGGHDVQPFAFGQNYWNWEPAWGNAVAGTEGLVRAAGVKLIRSGGANNELETPNPF